MLLSVCLPTYNRAAFLRLSVRYWLEQLAPFAGEVELIVADNASTDETLAVLEAARALGSFRIVARLANLDFNLSTHDLVTAQAQGEYIWVCGDDDYLNPGALAQVVSALRAHPEQDHFYITTQFIPHDYAPDVTREDPRQSPHLRPPGLIAPGGVVRHTGDLLAIDPGGFGGFYSSIWRRALAVAALSGEFHAHAPFTTLESTLPYAVYIARHRLDKPSYRIGPPILTVVHTVSWPQHAAYFRLKILPELWTLYRVYGVPRKIVRPHQIELLEHWPRNFIALWRRAREKPLPDFSFGAYLMRHAPEPRFWKELLRYLWCDLLP